MIRRTFSTVRRQGKAAFAYALRLPVASALVISGLWYQAGLSAHDFFDRLAAELRAVPDITGPAIFTPPLRAVGVVRRAAGRMAATGMLITGPHAALAGKIDRALDRRLAARVQSRRTRAGVSLDNP